jgi:hypothetical protein
LATKTIPGLGEVPEGYERVFLGYGPKNQYTISGKIHVGGYADMPNKTAVEKAAVADLKHRIAQAQVGRHEDDIVSGHDGSGEWPEDMEHDDFVEANRLQKLDHDRYLAEQAKLAQQLGQPSADVVVDAANAHIDKVFSEKAKAEQIKVEGAVAQMAETQQQLADLSAANAPPPATQPSAAGLGAPVKDKP